MWLFNILLSFCVCFCTKGVIGNSQRKLSLTYTPSLGDTSPGSVWPQPQWQHSTLQVLLTYILNCFDLFVS